MTVRTIIALAGRAGAGKDTAAEYLKDAIWNDYPGDAIVVTGFARRMKRALQVLFDIDFENLSRAEKEERLDWIGKSPRELMQWFGTECGRHLHAELWVLLLERTLFDSPRRGPCGTFGEIVILTDCRFANEVAWVRRKEGTIWWIERDGIAPVARHSSESSIGPADCDRTILNMGTKEDLATELARAWAQQMAAVTT